MKKRTAVILESFQGTLRSSSLEALTCAVELSSEDGDEVALILLDGDPEGLAAEISEKNGLGLVAVRTAESSYNSDVTRSILGDLLPELAITHVCLSGTTQGLDYGPALAVRLKMACISGVEKVESNASGFFVSRSIYGGKIVEKTLVSAAGAVIITQPGTFKPFSAENAAEADVELKTFDTLSETVKNIEVKQVQQESSALAEASVIVSAGRGIKEQENLELIEQLAGVFPRSAVGGSRPLCDLEWLPYRQQIGITGATVTPELYLACGISGAAQHISGMRNSGLIVSVNLDPKAAIFNYSDVCIVEDLSSFIPVFIETVQRKKQA